MITPNSIDIDEEPVHIVFEKPVSAITESASINIDISTYISSTNASEGFKEIDSAFPVGCVKAILLSKQGESITLSKSSGRWGGDKKMLNLSSNSGTPTGVKYVSMKISSCEKINNTVVTWYNYSK